jgi:threonine synthase
MSIAYRGRLVCIRCGAPRDEDTAYTGCPACAAEGVPVAVRPDYAITPGPLPISPSARGVFRWGAALPLAADASVTTLDEGGTPLLELSRLGAELGMRRLLLKDESRNPTWSWKDRLAATAISKAVASRADTVIVSTTGNHGAAVAAYAAAAGLRCVALTLTSVPATMRTLMQSYGARVVAYETGPDRWKVMAEAVEAYGWVPMSGFQNPPVGSNPFGVDGYKTIAFELWEDLGEVPDVVAVPAAYADGLAGIFRGFADLRALGVTTRMPRLVAAEPFGPYRRALTDGSDVAGPVEAGPSTAFSIATPVGTYQGVDALRRTGGTAVVTGGDDAIMTMQARLAAAEGLYLEASSVTPLLAAAALAGSGEIGPDDTVVVVGTSTGLKDVGATAARLPEPPVADPTLQALEAITGGP